MEQKITPDFIKHLDQMNIRVRKQPCRRPAGGAARNAHKNFGRVRGVGATHRQCTPFLRCRAV